MKPVRRWTNVGILLFGHLAAAPPASSQVVTPTGQVGVIQKRIEMAAARQKTAASAMAASIDRQTDSVRRQVANTRKADFFVLSTPDRLRGQTPVEPECDPWDSAAERDGVETGLTRSIIKRESAVQPCRIFSQGADLIPFAQTPGDLDVSPQQNHVADGTGLLRRLLQYYGRSLVLTPDARPADGDWAVPGLPETANEVQRIFSFLPLEETRSLWSDPDLTK